MMWLNDSYLSPNIITSSFIYADVCVCGRHKTAVPQLLEQLSTNLRVSGSILGSFWLHIEVTLDKTSRPCRSTFKGNSESNRLRTPGLLIQLPVSRDSCPHVKVSLNKTLHRESLNP